MGYCLETFIKFITSIVPFISPYPWWVKSAISLFVLSAAVSIIGLIVAAPKQVAHSENQPLPSKAWLIVEGVTAFGRFNPAVKVTADINGGTYVYPTLNGVDWLEVGPTMAPQRFRIPLNDTYDVRFSIDTRDGRSLASVETQVVKGSTQGSRRYSLREVFRGQRSAPISAEVSYQIVVE